MLSRLLLLNKCLFCRYIRVINNSHKAADLLPVVLIVLSFVIIELKKKQI